MRRSRHYSGFTLIELLIVVVIIGILAAVAIPNYSAYVQRGKITEATSTLAQQKIFMERYYQDNRNYGSTSGNAWNCPGAAPVTPSFTYTCNQGPGGTNQSFLITATGNAGNGMNGFVFTIDQNNTKQTTSFGGDGVTRNCWISKQADTC